MWVKPDDIYDENGEVVGWEFECPVCHEWSDYYYEDLEKRAGEIKTDFPF